MKGMIKGPYSPNSKRESLSYFLTHMNEIDVYQMFEDEFDCSGICNRGLFYFG